MSNATHKIIEKEFKNGLFPKVPATIPGYAVLLRNSSTGEIVCVSHRTTPRTISIGKYDKLIEVQTGRNLYRIDLTSPSISDKYIFDVTVKVYITVCDPVSYYLERETDFLKTISDILYPEIRKATKRYDVIDYKNIEDALTQQLQVKSFGKEIPCIEFEFYDIQVQPEHEAMKYVKRTSDAWLEKKAKQAEADAIADIQKYQGQKASEMDLNMEKAIVQEVMDGKIPLHEAITKIDSYNQAMGEQKLENVQKLIGMLFDMKNQEIISDLEVEKQVMHILQNATIGTDNLLEDKNTSDKEDADFPTQADVARVVKRKRK